MYEAREKVFWFAIITRITVLILQFLFNILCPDHESDVFISPTDPREIISFFDKSVSFLFGGLTRWDAQYFLHISKYGYTYENTLAFYPLYPMIIRLFAIILKNVLFLLNDHNATILSGVLINFYCFIKSSLVLYDLTLLVTKNPKLSYRSSILYCVNPASIFFSAIYTESMFAYLSFYVMLASFNNNPYVFVPLSLSTIIRSNGLTNFGFPLFAWLKNFLSVNLPNFVSENRHCTTKVSLFSLRHICVSLFQITVTVILSFIPIVLLQIYNYTKFCTPQLNETSLPLHVVHHAIENKLILPGSEHYSLWCHYTVPVSYSYVQNKYWNVGFLRYYEFKQIPNFFLALPILFIMIRCTYEFFREHKGSQFLSFMLDKRECTSARKYPLDMLAFVIHGLFLTLFCILFVHIQVSTRLLASASPLPYWFCALVMSRGEKEKRDVDELDYEDPENIDSTWKVFFLMRDRIDFQNGLILAYFLGYFVLGCFMYSNFLPWT